MSRSHFRLVAWNIRAGGGKRWTQIVQHLLHLNADALVLSEYRSTPSSQAIAAELANGGLAHQATTTDAVGPGCNGLLLASRASQRTVALRQKPLEPGRWHMLRLQLPRLSIGGLHIPNQHTGRKPAFHNAVLELAQRWRGGPAIIAGDTNSGRIGIDEQSAVFNRATHQWFDDLEAAGWRDAFRLAHGDRREYTWYSPGHDNGFRLDQAFLSPQLVPRLLNAQHLWLPDPAQPQRRDAVSDHAALIVDLDLADL